MTEKTLEKANELYHDINILKEIKNNQDEQRWVGFRVPMGSSEFKLDDFYSDEVNDAFKEFIHTQLDRVKSLLDEL